METPQLDGPFGARGVGEHPMISVAPALGNAIHAAGGAELMHMPIRFEDVWRAINAHEPIDNWITESPVGSCRSQLASATAWEDPCRVTVTAPRTGRRHQPRHQLPG